MVETLKKFPEENQDRIVPDAANIDTNGLLIKASPLRYLYRDWDTRRAGRPFPARADFDPLELRYILGCLSLVDVLRDPLRFIFRLHASQNAARLGADLTGKELAAMPAWTDPATVRTQYEHVVASCTPQVCRNVGTHADGSKWEYEVLVLPLSTGGDAVDMLMAGMSWTAL